MLYEDNDVSKLSWQLFERTGKISYYLLHSSLKEINEKEEKEKRR
jgi:hypothetical protein